LSSTPAAAALTHLFVDVVELMDLVLSQPLHHHHLCDILPLILMVFSARTENSWTSTGQTSLGLDPSATLALAPRALSN
jgi:hypothetical protein